MSDVTIFNSRFILHTPPVNHHESIPIVLRKQGYYWRKPGLFYNFTLTFDFKHVGIAWNSSEGCATRPMFSLKCWSDRRTGMTSLYPACYFRSIIRWTPFCFLNDIFHEVDGFGLFLQASDFTPAIVGVRQPIYFFKINTWQHIRWNIILDMTKK
jgi:hypothetical protein